MPKNVLNRNAVLIIGKKYLSHRYHLRILVEDTKKVVPMGIELTKNDPVAMQSDYSSSSCRAASTDITDPLSPPLPIVHNFRLVFRATPRILTELLYLWFELVTLLLLDHVKGSSLLLQLDSFRDGR